MSKLDGLDTVVIYMVNEQIDGRQWTTNKCMKDRQTDFSQEKLLQVLKMQMYRNCTQVYFKIIGYGIS